MQNFLFLKYSKRSFFSKQEKTRKISSRKTFQKKNEKNKKIFGSFHGALKIGVLQNLKKI